MFSFDVMATVWLCSGITEIPGSPASVLRGAYEEGGELNASSFLTQECEQNSWFPFSMALQ